MILNRYTLSSADGATHDLILSAPGDKPQSPLFFCLPAMGVPARKYQLLAEKLLDSGFAVALFEWRGIDSSSVRASRRHDFGYHTILTLDLPVALERIRQDFPQNPIYLLGHSLGGQLGLLLMCQYPEEIAGMVGVASGTPYFKGWQFPHDIGLFVASKLMRWIAAAVGHFPGRKLGFGGREARQLIRDWSVSVASGEYHVEGSDKDFEALCQQLHKPALMVTIDEDILAPPQSAKNLGDKLSSGQVSYAHLGAADFRGDSLGHFNWMREPEPIIARIVQWMAVSAAIEPLGMTAGAGSITD